MLISSPETSYLSEFQAVDLFYCKHLKPASLLQKGSSPWTTPSFQPTYYYKQPNGIHSSSQVPNILFCPRTNHVLLMMRML